MYKPSKYNLTVETDDRGRTLLYNTVSGAVCWINQDIHQIILKASELNEDQIPNEIIRLGFVVTQSADETDKLMFHKKRYIYNSCPEYITYVIAPTLSCNYKCSYCFEKNASHVKTMDDSTLPHIEKFIEREIKKYPSLKGIRITWFGGEPCLQLERIEMLSKRLISLTQNSGLEYAAFMVTNGLLLTFENALRLNKVSHLTEAQITLDGLALTYRNRRSCDIQAFDKVIRNIIEVSNILKLHIRINVDEENMQEIKQLLDLLFEKHQLHDRISLYFAIIKNYTSMTVNPLKEANFESFRKNLIDYVQLKLWGKAIRIGLPVKVATACGAMKNYNCVIGPEGELYRCEHCLGMPKWVIGDVINGFYHNQADEAFLEAKLDQKCLNCSLLPVCAGGCLADRILNKLEFDCNAYQERIKINVRLAVNKRVGSGISETGTC